MQQSLFTKLISRLGFSLKLYIFHSECFQNNTVTLKWKIMPQTNPKPGSWGNLAIRHLLYVFL